MSRKNTGDEKMSLLDQIKENWNKNPLIIRVTFILLVISFIYDMVTGQTFSIFFSVCLLLFIIAELVNWFYYKKE
ncbi:MAG: hypothetical protein J6B73_06815 [Methanobrevibacter sp.]|uniref:Uncharacterized protein n=1 Tax=Methanobrevibacter millerae TaxID=230361 RepID=A0A8T3VMB0_9EURY|nr:hypothetical protein [Methanobrevibacter sp.]MBE6511060.1 hypothetical protein [Methanobrevibacter millerae]MBO5151848.1 hypothetical protein [Methanobrevibacter sp.]